MNAVIRIEYFSDCTGVNPPLKSEATFPVMQGHVLTVTCEAGHILSGYDKITCSHHMIFTRDNEVYNPSCSELILNNRDFGQHFEFNDSTDLYKISAIRINIINCHLQESTINSLSFISRPLRSWKVSNTEYVNL